MYSGYFINDLKHGFGNEYYHNGVIKYQGFFNNNKYVLTSNGKLFADKIASELFV